MIFFEVAFMSCCGENPCIACNDDKEDIIIDNKNCICDYLIFLSLFDQANVKLLT